MNSIKKLINKIDRKKVVNTSLLLAGTACLVAVNSHTAFAAAGDLGISATDTKTVTTAVYDQIKPALQAIASLGVVAALATVGIGIIMSNKKPEDRAMIMGRVPWIAGGALLVTGIATFTGWILNFSV